MWKVENRCLKNCNAILYNCKMKKIPLSFILIIVSAVMNIYGSKTIIDLSSGKHTTKVCDTNPIVEFREFGDTLSIHVKIRYVAMDYDENDVATIDIPGFVNNATPGEPMLPQKLFNIRHMRGMAPDVEIEILNSVEMPLDIHISDEPIPETEFVFGRTPIQTTPKPSGIKEFNFEDVVIQYPSQYYRGRGFTPYCIRPVQYNYKEKKAIFNNDIIYRFKFNDNPDLLSETPLENSEKQMLIANNDCFFDEFTVGSTESNPICKETFSGELYPQPARKGYLILTVNDHYSAAKKLATWKMLMGYNVEIIQKRAVSKDIWPWTSNLIMETIINQAKKDPNLYYVLIIGDDKQLPGKLYKHHYQDDSGIPIYFMSDFQYGCLDGDSDITQDLIVGRLPVSTLEESSNIINKIVDFELNPVENADFYKNAFNASEFTPAEGSTIREESMFVYTSEKIREGLQNICGMNIRRIYAANKKVDPQEWNDFYVYSEKFPEDIKRPLFSWSGCSDDIVSAINEGCLYGFYRGHSSFNKWGAELEFTSDDLSKLNNKGRYPLIFSMTCRSGAYNKYADCLAKRFLITSEAGACGVIAATETTYSRYNDVLAGAIFRGIWPDSGISIIPKGIGSAQISNSEQFIESLVDNKHQFGNILNFGMNVLSVLYPENGSGYATLTKRLYHCFGDPSMEFRKKTPKRISDVIVKVENDGFRISGDTYDYPYGATISVIDTVFNTTLAYESLRDMKINVLNPNTCKICISGRDLKPLLIDGRTGYDGRYLPSIANRSDGLCEYLDFNTLKRDFRQPPINHDYADMISYIDDRTVEINIPGVYIVRSENYEYWDIPGAAYSAKDYGEPNLPLLDIWFPESIYYNEGESLKFIDGDYIDFKDIECMPFHIIVDCLDCDNSIRPITPYSGFWPEDFKMDGGYSGNSNYMEGYVCDRVCPLKYDYENKVMRAYTRLRIRRDSESSKIININAANRADQEVFYTIDGRVERNPQRNNIYIKRDGEAYSKILY